MYDHETVLNRMMVFALARHFGIPIIEAKFQYTLNGNKEFPYWDGSRLFIKQNTQTNQILHEICHWVVADSNERLEENYGLRTDVGEDETQYELDREATASQLESFALHFMQAVEGEVEVLTKDIQRRGRF